jgi:3',5'-cyclic-AMP phosphodiesterase
MDPDTVVFAHISDTHFGPAPDYIRHGFAALPCAERLVAVLNDLPFRLDFAVHTGDVVTEPDERSYRLAAATFARLACPVYYVPGNHDAAAQIRRLLPMGPCRTLADDPDLLTFAFEARGQRFLVVDACGPAEVDPHGVLSTAQLAVLDGELTPDGPPLSVFCHFPPLPMGIPWIDETMLILNGEELHRRLAAAGPRLRGVFIGHVHQALTVHRDGVLYSAAPSAFAQLGGDPSDRVPRVDRAAPPGFTIVQVGPAQTVVRVHAFARPEADADPSAAMRVG